MLWAGRARRPSPTSGPSSTPPWRDDPEASLPAQVLVDLLVRLGRLDEAIDVAADHLAQLPESALICPGIAELCQRAGRMSPAREIARGAGEPVNSWPRCCRLTHAVGHCPA